MANDTLCCNYLRGNVYIAKVDESTCVSGFPTCTEGLTKVGNVSALELDPTITEVTTEDFTQLGGNACSLKYIDALNLNITFECINVRNLLIAMGGSGSFENQMAGSTGGEGEAHVVPTGDLDCALITTNNIPTETTPIISVTDGPGTTTYVEGTDYNVVGLGIEIIATGAITAGQTILIDYNYITQSCLDLLTTTSGTYKVIVDATNSNDGKRWFFNLFNVEFAPGSFQLFGTTFANLAITAEVKKNPCSTGTGSMSDYGQIKIG